MDAPNVFRLMSLIPDRALRAQTGGLFLAEGKSERVVLLARFLHWLGPLDALSKEDQHLLGVRSSGGKSMAEDGEGEDLDAGSAEADEAPRNQEVETQETGTRLAV
jgi:hypothetical protein